MANITISQNLTIPSGLAAGQVASATHITPLYNQMNAFLIPSTVGAMQQALVSTGVDTVGTGSSQDYTISGITKDKALLIIMTYNWSGSTASTIQFRLNATAITPALALGTAITGGGVLVGFVGGHDGTFTAGAGFLVTVNDGGGLKSTAANTTLPNADYSSFGVAAGGAGATVTVGYKLIMNQG